jgi:four helix bundle protein
MSTSTTITTFRDLRVWQAGMELAEEVYRLTQSFPAEEMLGLTALMRRTAISIPSHVAEGQSSENREEYQRHVAVAYQSTAALQTQIELAGRLGYLATEEVTRMLDHAVSVSKQLYNLRGALAKKGSAAAAPSQTPASSAAAASPAQGK